MSHTYPEKVGIVVVALVIATLIYIQFRPLEVLGYDPVDWAGWVAVGIGAFMLTLDVALYEPEYKRHGIVYLARMMHGLILVTGLILVYQYLLPDYAWNNISLSFLIVAWFSIIAIGSSHGHKKRRGEMETPIESL